MTILYKDIVQRSSPTVDGERLYKEVLKSNQQKIIVLDDDPTGTQTVHGLNVYTDWSYASILQAFQEENKVCFILTNSRSFSLEKTKEVHTEIARNIVKAAREVGKEYLLLSRGDSTLRGYYPEETETLKNTIEQLEGVPIDGEIVVPFFLEGGRYTVDDVHYVKNEEVLIPVGETEFAKDATFGYKSSNLKDWIAEKTKQRYSNSLSISLNEIRAMQVDVIKQKLLQVKNFQKVIVNALDYEDLKVFTSVFLPILKEKRYLVRCGASFVKVVGGIEDCPLLVKEDIIKESTNGGIVIIGSHVEKTTRQLNQLKSQKETRFIEFNNQLIFDDEAIETEIARVVEEAEEVICKGRNVVVFTKREKMVVKGNKQEQLKVSVKISEAVTSIIKRLQVKPRYIIAKGGITSSDVATLGLGIKKAWVLGQIEPGIPVWLSGKEAKFPGMPYIIFPGNVGDDMALKRIMDQLSLSGKDVERP